MARSAGWGVCIRGDRPLTRPRCFRIASTLSHKGRGEEFRFHEVVIRKSEIDPCRVGQITGTGPRSPRRHEGRFAVVTERGAGCDGRCGVRQVSAGRNVRSVRRSRVVLAPRPWRLFCGRYPADNGDNKRRSPGRARISRKAIAWGKPGCLGCTCSSCPCASHMGCPCAPARGICGRSQRPAFPAPSVRERGNEIASSGKNRAVRTSAHAQSTLSSLRKQGPIRRGGNC